MQITIDLPTDLEQDLIRQAAQSNVPLKTLILETLRQRTQTTSGSISQWSDAVLSYEGNPDFPAIEFYRNELLPLCESENPREFDRVPGLQTENWRQS